MAFLLYLLISLFCLQTSAESTTSFHIWSTDNGIALPEQSIHHQTIQGHNYILGLALPTKSWFPLYISCLDCPDQIIIRMDEDPHVIALDILNRFIALGVTGFDLQNLSDMVGDAQLHQYLVICGELQRYLGTKGFPNWEGGTSSFLGKLRLMRSLILKPNIQTVCEIGFNNGASSLLWLVSGAKKVFSFDIGSHEYGTHAIEWLSQRFLGKFQVILGDSQYTVPSFHEMFPNEKCDLIFIDGGHRYQNAIKDLINFKDLHSNSHVVLMDDISEPEVAQAWQQVIDSGFVIEEGRISSSYSESFLSPFSEKLDFLNGRLIEDPDFIQLKYTGGMSFGKYVA